MLTDFLAELTSSEPDEGTLLGACWALHVDGFSTASASGTGLLLTTPEEIKIEYVIRLRFKAMNNEVEYEALITGLNAAKDVGASRIIVYTNSKLVEG